MGNKIKELEALTEGRRKFLSGLLGIFAAKGTISKEIREGLKGISRYFGIRGYNFSNLKDIKECYHDFTRLQEGEY